jgi:hypothetical protein
MAKKLMTHSREVPLALLCKLGSIAVHIEEALSIKGHPFDIEALKVLIHDPDVQAWLKAMGPLVPRKR